MKTTKKVTAKSVLSLISILKTSGVDLANPDHLFRLLRAEFACCVKNGDWGIARETATFTLKMGTQFYAANSVMLRDLRKDWLKSKELVSRLEAVIQLEELEKAAGA